MLIAQKLLTLPWSIIAWFEAVSPAKATHDHAVKCNKRRLMSLRFISINYIFKIIVLLKGNS